MKKMKNMPGGGHVYISVVVVVAIVAVVVLVLNFSGNKGQVAYDGEIVDVVDEEGNIAGEAIRARRAPSGITAREDPVSACFNSDGGPNPDGSPRSLDAESLVAGYVTLTTQSGRKYTSTDICNSNDELIEYWCAGYGANLKVLYSSIRCTCSAGACIR